MLVVGHTEGRGMETNGGPPDQHINELAWRSNHGFEWPMLKPRN